MILGYEIIMEICPENIHKLPLEENIYGRNLFP